jgi:hypothetical protein
MWKNRNLHPSVEYPEKEHAGSFPTAKHLCPKFQLKHPSRNSTIILLPIA